MNLAWLPEKHEEVEERFNFDASVSPFAQAGGRTKYGTDCIADVLSRSSCLFGISSKNPFFVSPKALAMTRRGPLWVSKLLLHHRLWLPLWSTCARRTSMSEYGAVADHSEFRAACFFASLLRNIYYNSRLQRWPRCTAEWVDRTSWQSAGHVWTCWQQLSSAWPDLVLFSLSALLCFIVRLSLNFSDVHQDPEADQGGATLVAGSLMDKIFGRRSLESRTNSFRSACFASQRSAKWSWHIPDACSEVSSAFVRNDFLEEEKWVFVPNHPRRGCCANFSGPACL